MSEREQGDCLCLHLRLRKTLPDQKRGSAGGGRGQRRRELFLLLSSACWDQARKPLGDGVMEQPPSASLSSGPGESGIVPLPPFQGD